LLVAGKRNIGRLGRLACPLEVADNDGVELLVQSG
jgi:hypothetical protein